MITCASCKNKVSTERCGNKPLKGLTLCATHVRVKTPRLWKDVNSIDEKVVLIQKVWRGYIVRSWIGRSGCGSQNHDGLAGPGTLKRSVCHNDEELVTLDDKKSVSPLDYFAFEEGGKVYWFDVRSILQNSFDKVRPTNPYTREPIPIDVRQRLRKVAFLRDHRKMPNLHDPTPPANAEARVQLVWTSVTQIIEENGFPDMSPMYFIALNRTQLYIFATMIHRDLTAWASEHTSKYSRRKRYLAWFHRLEGEYLAGSNGTLLSFLTAKCLLTMLNDYPEPYTPCFIIMSALHRM